MRNEHDGTYSFRRRYSFIMQTIEKLLRLIIDIADRLGENRAGIRHDPRSEVHVLQLTGLENL